MELILHDSVDRTELDRLLKTEAPWYLSLFLPTVKTGPDTRQNSIRYKNLVKKTLDIIKDRDVRDTLASLEEEYDFWNTQRDGLAIMGTPTELHLYVLPVSLPERVNLGHEFQLRPLLPYLHNNGSFLVLTIEKQAIRLWIGSHFDALEEIPLPDIPTSFEDYLDAFDIKTEVQFRGGSFGAGGNQAMFHGHGDVTTEEQAEIKKFFHHFDRNVNSLLKEYDLPLVLVGVEDILPVYLDTNTYAKLISTPIDAQPESLSEEKLRLKAWQLVQPVIKQEEINCRQKIRRREHTEQVSQELAAIIQTGYQGKVEALLIETDFHKWGSFDPDTNKVTFHSEKQADSQDLAEVATQWSMKRGGGVYLGTEKTGHPAVALMRY